MIRPLCVSIFCLCLALLAFANGASPQMAGNTPKHPFPMSEGTYWIYQGLVRWNDSSNNTKETKVTWRMEIRRLIQHNDGQAAIVHGFPYDLDWSDGKAEPSDSALVESNGKFYLLTKERFTQTRPRVEQPSEPLANLPNEDELFLSWPLSEGKKFCDAEGMARTDNRYCWVVESVRQNPLQGIPGVQPGERTEFTVAYRTNPDHNRFTFVPDIGLTTYEYHHHGTVADTELKLVEFHQPSASK